MIRLAGDTTDVGLRTEALAALGLQVGRLGPAAGSDPASPDRRMLAEAASVALAASRHPSSAVRRAATAVLGALPETRARLEELAKADPAEDAGAGAIEQLRRGRVRRR